MTRDDVLVLQTLEVFCLEKSQWGLGRLVMSGDLAADVKNRRGKASRGRKITGLQFLPNDPAKLLITSNDSRIRLYDGVLGPC